MDPRCSTLCVPTTLQRPHAANGRDSVGGFDGADRGLAASGGSTAPLHVGRVGDELAGLERLGLGPPLLLFLGRHGRAD